MFKYMLQYLIKNFIHIIERMWFMNKDIIKSEMKVNDRIINVISKYPRYNT